MASHAISERAGATSVPSWAAGYAAKAPSGDVLTRASGRDADAWTLVLDALAGVAGDRLSTARERAQRQADDIGTGYRIAGESEERRWPLSPLPLLIGADEWAGIAAGIVQRAELLERLCADIYGENRLVSESVLPAGLVTGSALFLRPLVGLAPPGGHHLHFIAADLALGPDGRWRVLADHLRAPAGAGYALENRLAVARTLGGVGERLNIERHAPFFAAMRSGIAAACHRTEPRIGLLTPGRLNPSYAEQAHLARYLGFLLVEGADLAVLQDRVYVRTIAGLKRIDALWSRLDPRMLDPLAFDAGSRIGVAGLVDALAAGNAVIANTPGAGVLESPALAAYLPALAERLTGRPVLLPGVRTWWCGDPEGCAHVRRNLDTLVIAPAFNDPPLGLPGGRAVPGADLSDTARAALIDDMERRPQDYVGREVACLSTMPLASDDVLVPRPFTLRVFAARGPDGAWTVLPGGFARIGEEADARATVMGEGSWSADVCIHGPAPVDTLSLLRPVDSVELRRNPGTLPSRVADNLFWLGRYLERGEALLAAIRVLLGHSIGADSGAALAEPAVQRLVALMVEGGAAPAPAGGTRRDLQEFAARALDGEDGWHSVRAINRLARGIGAVSRERLAADMVRLLDAPHPHGDALLDRAGALQRRYAALAGLSSEHMGRTDAWRFHDLGRRIERAGCAARAIRAFVAPEPDAEDLSTLLDLADSQISYRQRYLMGMARAAVLDLVALDPGNPRGLAYQVQGIARHLAELPVLSDSGVAEAQQQRSTAICARVATATPDMLSVDWLRDIEAQLARLADEIARRYFLQGAEPLREKGLTLA